MQENESALRSRDDQPVRYLVVDDSLFARKNLGRLLEKIGGEVAGEAGHGLEAVQQYDRLLPDIVFMDVTMPGMEGIEAAERIIQQHPDARIVMVASVGDQENITEALRKGVRHFIQKPPNPELLSEVIHHLLHQEDAPARAAIEKVRSYEN
jgi:two-component system, chemotaxis family, chemotaxis protein CheY